MTHPIENIMKSTMEEIKDIVDVNTIVGNPILAAENTLVLPVSKVSLGFLSGGGEYQGGSDDSTSPVRKAGEAVEADTRYPFAGAAVAGMSITPMGFLTVSGGNVRMIQVRYDSSLERVIDQIPMAFDTIVDMIKNNGRDEDARENTETLS